MSSVEKEPCAKVNLGLRVVGRRADGYHNIETLFHTIALHDRVTIEERDSGILVTADLPGIPQGNENLAYAAALKTLEKAGSKAGVKIEIEKRIPAGGGLGGASSDAAAVIEGVNELLDLDMGEKELREIAGTVGSDVPFFIRGGVALAKGRGDELEYLEKGMKLNLIVVFPGFPISTSWAYSMVDSGLTPDWFDIMILAGALEQGDLSSLCRSLYNSFEEVVFGHYPGLFEIKKRMMELGALGSLLCGSGSCIFCIAEDEDRASDIEEGLKERNLSVWKTTTCW